MAERLLHHHPRVVRAAGLLQPLDHRAEQAGRDRQVVQRPLRLAQRLAQLGEGLRVGVVAVDVLQPCRKLVEHRLVELLAVLLGRLPHAVERALAQLLHRPAGQRHADHRHLQVAVARHRQQRREDLLVGQVAGGAEENQCIRAGCRHRGSVSGESRSRRSDGGGGAGAGREPHRDECACARVKLVQKARRDQRQGSGIARMHGVQGKRSSSRRPSWRRRLVHQRSRPYDRRTFSCPTGRSARAKIHDDLLKAICCAGYTLR